MDTTSSYEHVVSPEEQVYKDALDAVSRNTISVVRVSTSLRDRIIVRAKHTILAGGDGIFQRFARSSTKNVISKY